MIALQLASPYDPPPDDPSLPLSVRVLNRLVPAILLTAELLEELAVEPAGAERGIEPVVRAAYDDLNALMGRLAQ